MQISAKFEFMCSRLSASIACVVRQECVMIDRHVVIMGSA